MGVMLGVFAVAQLAAAMPARDSTYSSRALASFIAQAAEANRVPPPPLRGYRARVESELSLLLRDTLGRERVAQVEQIAMASAWSRNQSYELRVVGYRSQTVGVPYSALSFARSWTLPSLYGDRLSLGVEMAGMTATRRSGRVRPDSVTPAAADTGPTRSPAVVRDRPRGQPLRAVHPLAGDRDRFYRFGGGDTVATLRSHGREIPIVRVHVVPVFDSVARTTPIGAFEGEIDFDATRHQIVRMRGQFVTSRSASPGQQSMLARLPGLVGVAFVEFVNAEVDGRYWLPAFQRSEFQASFAPLGPARSVFRLVSRFADLRVETAGDSAFPARTNVDTAAAVVEADSVAGSNSIAPYRRRLTFAPADSVSRYGDWVRPLGAATGEVSASDFDDLAPDVWRVDGPPRVDLMPTKLDEIARFNRVEGGYTGAAIAVRFRNAAPGLTAHAFGGWAWREETLRGGGSVALRRGLWTTNIRAERSLSTTNDFTPPLEGSGVGLAALFAGLDDQDYVDRRVVSAGVARAVRSMETALLTAEVGIAEDRKETARLEHGLFGSGRFRFNRGSVNGRYARGAATLEIHPDVTGIFLQPGVGAELSYEIARGQLNWQRTELTLATRAGWRDIVLAGRAQGGMVIGNHPPPQTLFELGGEGVLPGYGYKEFAGDRAATAGLLAAYTFPLLRRPWRLVRSLVIPGLSPGIASGIQGGWAEASSAGARAAMSALDPGVSAPCDPQTLAICVPPISRPTDGVRATVDARLTFFGGMLGVGVARPVDHSAPWRLVFRAGQEF